MGYGAGHHAAQEVSTGRKRCGYGSPGVLGLLGMAALSALTVRYTVYPKAHSDLSGLRPGHAPAVNHANSTTCA